METQKTPIINSILSKKNDTECITIPDFKLSYRATVTQIARWWHKNRHIEQLNWVEDSEISHRATAKGILTSMPKYICQIKDSVCNNWCWENWMSPYSRL
jgi:hypothetical protein